MIADSEVVRVGLIITGSQPHTQTTFFSWVLSEIASCDSMKALGAIVVLALVLAVLGAGLSFSGYSEGLQIRTLSNTQSYTTTLANTIEIFATQTSVIKTTSRENIFVSRVLLSVSSQKYCYYDFRVLNLTKGQIHAEVSGASFWILSQDDYMRWLGRGTCEEAALFKGGLEIPTSGQVEVPAGGPYYFVFLSQEQSPYPPMVLVNVYSIHEGQITTADWHLIFSTEQTAFPTRTVTYSTQPVGFGLIFYLGTGLAGVAGVASVISGMSYKQNRVRFEPTIPVARPPLNGWHDPGCRCDFHRLPRYARESQDKA